MEYKHFSHPHTLKVHQVHTHKASGSSLLCSGCESAITGSAATAYICSTCDFNLHEQCGNAPRGMQHPSHAGLHHLTLVPYTTYSAGSYLCRACGFNGGKGFSYCCPLCDFDLHVQCAHLPQVMAHESHPFHSLVLVYNSAPPATPFTQFAGYTNQLVCNLCNVGMDGRFWSYNCYACNYHVHASCAVNKPEPVVASGEKCETSDEGKEAEAEPVPCQGLETEQAEQVVEDPALRQQLELQRLQLELDMSSALANMIGSFNLSSLV
ncbi:unnamed protein product [Cochlearia groenlandica]